MKKKWELPFYSFYDVKGMERHLEKLAARGWMLEKLGNYGWTYVRCEPKQVHFTVTYYPKASAFDPEPTEGQQTFEEFCGHSGWQLVGSNAKLMVFVNEREDPVPIHTDPGMELEMMEKVGRQMVGTWIVLLAFLGWNLFLSGRRFLARPIQVLSSNFSMGFLPVELLMVLYFILDLATWYGWRRRARQAAEREEPLPAARGHQKLIAATFLLAIGLMVVTLLFDGESGLRPLLLAHMTGLILLCLAVNGIRMALKRRKASRAKNMVITLLADLVLAMVLTGTVIWVTSQFRGTERAGEITPAITAEELSGIPQPGAMQKVSRYSSLLVTDTKVWDMPSGRVPRKEVRSLSYELVEIRFDPVYHLCLRDLYHRYDRYGDHSEDFDEEDPFYVYKPMDPEPWGAEEVWQLWSYGKPKSTYLVCWADRILEFEAGWPLDEEEMALAARRLGPET